MTICEKITRYLSQHGSVDTNDSGQLNLLASHLGVCDSSASAYLARAYYYEATIVRTVTGHGQYGNEYEYSIKNGQERRHEEDRTRF